MSFFDLAGQDLPVVGPDGVYPVLVVRVLDAGEHVGVAAPGLLRDLAAGALLVLAAQVRLPGAAVAVDPDPALAAVEEVADLLRALVVGVDAAGGELQDLAVRIGEERRVDIRRLLRAAAGVEEAAGGADLHGVDLLAEAPARDVELVRALVAGVAVAV